MTKAVKRLTIVVILQGVVLAGVVVHLVSSRMRMTTRELHTERVVASNISLRRHDGEEMAKLRVDAHGASLKLRSDSPDESDIMLGTSGMGPVIRMRRGEGGLSIEGRSAGTRLEIEDQRLYPSRLVLGSAQRTLVGNTYTNCWTFTIPGVASGSYPEHENKLREQLAALTPASSRHHQREVLTQLRILGLFVDELPSVFALCERFPEEKEFPWPFVTMFESLEGHADELIASLRRQPSCVGILILKRMINGKTYEIDGVDLRELLAQIAKRDDLSAPVREYAERLHQHTIRFYPREEDKPTAGRSSGEDEDIVVLEDQP